MQPPVNEYSAYLKNKFGEKVQKISIDASMTCPNRDGRVGFGGCTFCNNKKFNRGPDDSESLSKQIERKIQYYKNKNNKLRKFLVYFQTYSNTYAPVEELRYLYNEALSVEGVEGLVIGTRPDCVNDDVLDLLQEFARKSYICLEYGLESALDSTLSAINRGHDVQCFINAVQKTKARGLPVGAHLIFGFPWENESVCFKAASLLNELSVDFVKVHNLQVVVQTRMALDYERKPFHLLSKEEYLRYLELFIIHLSEKIVVQRVAGDCPKDILLATGFTENSRQIREELISLMKEKKSRQGMFAS